jgi:hypothetical protein
MIGVNSMRLSKEARQNWIVDAFADLPAEGREVVLAACAAVHRALLRSTAKPAAESKAAEALSTWKEAAEDSMRKLKEVSGIPFNKDDELSF